MKTTFKEENGVYVMYFEGRHDTAAAPVVEKEMQVLNDCTGHNIILDCTDLEYISSSGLRLFLSTLKNAQSKGSKVSVKGMNEDIRNVFAMTGFISLFNIL